MNSEPGMNRYRLFRRASGVHYLQDNQTGKQESLRTKDPVQAERAWMHRNESASISSGHQLIALGYLQAADPDVKTRKWSHVMDAFCEQENKPSTIKRKLTAMKDPAFGSLRNMVVVTTTAEQILAVLKMGTVSTNCYLRKLHNLARDMDWLPKDALKRRRWPVVRYGKKRAIILPEHERILAVTPTLERRRYYQVLWETGAAQSDIANLTADRIDQENGTILFHRMKLDERDAGEVNLVMGPTLEEIISTLPKTGLLFPTLAEVGENDRATAFSKHCEKAGVEGVTLHSYRYALIQRAQACGYNKRHSMAMVGQSNESTHNKYAKGGPTTVPSLEECELAFRAAQEERLKARAEKRSKIINLRDHSAARGSEQQDLGVA